MMKHLLPVALIVIAACSSTSEEAPQTDDGIGDAGVLAFRLDIGDSVPVGPLHAELTITREGQPVTGANVWVAAKMPGHTHASDGRRAEELGGGVYEIDGIALDMPGEWELELDAEAEDAHDSASFEVLVE